MYYVVCALVSEEVNILSSTEEYIKKKTDRKLLKISISKTNNFTSSNINMTRLFLLATILVSSGFCLTTGFTSPSLVRQNVGTQSTNALFILGGNKKKKNDDIDLSSIETRDLTREEMLAINKQNEEIMNMELQMMTLFSLVLSLPILYLCWVAFYSE